MAVVEIPDFVKGKRTRKGRPLPPGEAPQPFMATVVTRDAIHDFLGTRTDKERDAHLRRLRSLGLLVTEPGLLTQRVRTAEGGRVRAYVFRGYADSILMLRRSRDRVIYW